MLVCSSFGQSMVAKDGVMNLLGGDCQERIIPTEYNKGRDLRRMLSEALFAFGYPQFDCYMPSLMQGIKRQTSVSSQMAYGTDEVLYEEYPRYAVHRAERLGSAWGIDLCPSSCGQFKPSSKELRAIDRELDKILDEMYAQRNCAIKRIFEDSVIEAVINEKNIPLRIRRKGMICQTEMWSESLGLVFN